MIYVNIFNISSDNKNIQVSVETKEGYNITSAKFWNQDTFKNESIDLTYKLEQINNKEIFNIGLADVNQSNYFEGIFFVEFTTNAPSEECSTCNNNVIAVAANFNNIKSCILNKLLSLNECGNIFTDASCNGNEGINIINLNLMLQALEQSLQFGYYDEALNIYNTLTTLCGEVEPCCEQLMSYIEYTGLSFATLNNTLVLA